MTTKRLIINADDFGYHEGVVQGIIDLHQAGLISSTSCMTNMPAWPLAAAYLRQHPELGAGVHLVFNDGCPVLPTSQVPALLGKDGQFLNNGQILRSLQPGTTDQLHAEFRAQIDRFIADAGRPPDHLSNHCAVSYIRPDRFSTTLELAREYDLPVRFPWGLGSLYRRRVDRAGIRHPNSFLQIFSPVGPRTVEQLLAALERARAGWVNELLTHPGYDGDWREEELRAFLDPRVRERLDEPDIELVSFAAV